MNGRLEARDKRRPRQFCENLIVLIINGDAVVRKISLRQAEIIKIVLEDERDAPPQ